MHSYIYFWKAFKIFLQLILRHWFICPSFKSFAKATVFFIHAGCKCYTYPGKQVLNADSARLDK